MNIKLDSISFNSKLSDRAACLLYYISNLPDDELDWVECYADIDKLDNKQILKYNHTKALHQEALKIAAAIIDNKLQDQDSHIIRLGEIIKEFREHPDFQKK